MATNAVHEDSGEAEPAQDSSVKQAGSLRDAPARAVNAGPQFTPYEKLLDKVATGRASLSELMEFAKTTKALKEEDDKSGHDSLQPGGTSPGMKTTQGGDADNDNAVAGEELNAMSGGIAGNPSAMPLSKGPAMPAANPAADQRIPHFPTQEEADDKDSDMRESLGYTAQEWRGLSVQEKASERRKWRLERLRESGVNNPISIAKARESRTVGDDINAAVLKGQLGENATKWGFGTNVLIPAGRGWKEVPYSEALDEMFRINTGESDRSQYRMSIPTFTHFDRAPEMGKEGQGLREFNSLMESYRASRVEALRASTRFVAEAIGTASSGLASGQEAMTPALVIPSQLAGLSREVVLFTPLPQGYKQHVFQMTTASTLAALSQNTDPGSTDPTLTTVNITTAEYGVEHQVSFSAERKGIGPLLDAFILGDRLGALYLDDQIIFGTAGAGGIENGSAGNKYYGNGTVTAESSISSSMTMAALAISTMVKSITAQGYSPDNLVCFMHPKQYNDLLNDTNIVRYLQIGAASGDYRDALIARGVIPDLYGVEIRRSTLVDTGTGSPSSVGTYHAYMMKKGLSVAMSASRDLMIETFRNINLNQTVTKTHIDYGAAVLHPNSVGIIYTA